jgi:serine/threonine protein kinase
MKKISTQNSVVQLIEVYDMVDWKVPSGSLFLVQELLEGTDLDKWISKGGSPLSTFEALEVLIQVGAALHAMHERDLIHRDVKPSNVFLSNSPSGSLCVTLLDFGLAKQAVFEPDKADGEEGNSSKYFSKPKLSKLEPSRRIIKRASLVGTKNFAAPEVIECSKVFGTYDMTVDAFSLGKTLRFALTGGNTRVGYATAFHSYVLLRHSLRTRILIFLPHLTGGKSSRTSPRLQTMAKATFSHVMPSNYLCITVLKNLRRCKVHVLACLSWRSLQPHA